MPFIIDPIIAINEVNSVCGAPGAGKTRFIAQLILAVINKTSFFGFKCAPMKSSTPIAYCAYDRSEAMTGELLDEFGLRDRIPWKSFRDIEDPDQPEPYPLEDLAKKYFVKVPIIVVDGAGLLYASGKSNDYGYVGKFLRYAGYVGTKYGITFIFLLHIPKVRAEGGIQNARQASIGSGVQGAMFEGMILIDHVDHTNLEDPRRTIFFNPHSGGKPCKIDVQINDMGWIEECGVEEQFKKRHAWYTILPPLFPRSIAIELGDKIGVSEPTIDRYLRASLAEGELVQPEGKKGPYKKVKPA